MILKDQVLKEMEKHLKFFYYCHDCCERVSNIAYHKADHSIQKEPVIDYEELKKALTSMESKILQLIEDEMKKLKSETDGVFRSCNFTDEEKPMDCDEELMCMDCRNMTRDAFAKLEALSSLKEKITEGKN